MRNFYSAFTGVGSFVERFGGCVFYVFLQAFNVARTLNGGEKGHELWLQTILVRFIGFFEQMFDGARQPISFWLTFLRRGGEGSG
jgi:hypothetical protein